MKDNGRLVCEPLLNGGKFCLYHTVIFTHFHVKVDDVIVVYLDFETTGLDVMKHNIVEIGLVEHSSSAVFSTAARERERESERARERERERARERETDEIM